MGDEPRICPKCRQEVPKEPECPRCGILVDKARELVDGRLAAKRLAPVVFSKPSHIGRKVTLGILFLLVVAGWFWIHRPEKPPMEVEGITGPTLAEPLSEAAPKPFPGTPRYSSDHWLMGEFGYQKGLLEQSEYHVPMVLYFRMDGDPDCGMVEADLFENQAVAAYMQGFIKIRLTPRDGPEEQALARQYRLKGFPSVLIGTPGSGEFRAVVTFTETGGKRRTLGPEAFVEGCKSLLAFLAQNQVFRGIQAERAHRPNEALEHFDRALEMDPENMEAYRGRGMARHRRGNLTGALEDFGTWTRTVENNPEANLHLASVYLDLGRFGEAIPRLDRVIGLEPRYKKGEAYLLRARAHVSLGDMAHAKEDAHAACELDNADGCILLRELTASEE